MKAFQSLQYTDTQTGAIEGITGYHASFTGGKCHSQTYTVHGLINRLIKHKVKGK